PKGGALRSFSSFHRARDASPLFQFQSLCPALKVNSRDTKHNTRPSMLLNLCLQWLLSVAQVIQNRLAPLGESGTDNSPQQILIFYLDANLWVHLHLHYAAP